MSVFNGNQIIDGNKVKFWLTRLRFYSMKTNVNKCWLNGEKNNSRKDSCNNTAYKRCVNGEREMSVSVRMRLKGFTAHALLEQFYGEPQKRARFICKLLPSVLILLHQLHLIAIPKTMFSIFRMCPC